MFLDKYIKQLEKERKATVRDLRGLATSQAVEEIKLLEQNKLLKRIIKELKAVKEFEENEQLVVDVLLGEIK